MRFPALTLALSLALMIPTSTLAQDGGDAVEQPAKKKKKKKKKGEDEAAAPEGALPAFAEVIADHEPIEGLFTFYRNEETGSVLLALTPEQLDQDFLLSSKIDRGVGEKGLYSGLMLDSYIVAWRSQNKRIQLVQRNTTFGAAEGTPEARAVALSFADSILASSAALSEPDPETGAIAVNLSDFFGGDFHSVGSYLSELYEGGFAADPENTAIDRVTSFPTNAEIGVLGRFVGEGEAESVALADDRTLRLGFRYSLLELPDNGYEPRIEDDRVGYFPTLKLDYSKPGGDTPYVRYIKRWHLEKKDPEAELSEPVEPIVFWLANTIPERYREALGDGVLAWNKAFEAAGFKDAIQVKQQPDDADWDPADARYNTIQWFVGYDASFAQGPSHADPRTGQLLDADIIFADGIIRYGALSRYRHWVDPVTGVREMIDELTATSNSSRCELGEGMAMDASFRYEVLAATSPDWSSEDEEEFTRQFLTSVGAHEVGHTLGLRHNFLASTDHTLEELFAWEGGGDTATSVMDYSPAIIAPADKTQPPYVPTEVGAYDVWAIQYGYTPGDDEAIAAIAAQTAAHPYNTDEDAGLGPGSIDPHSTRYDFTADPLTYAEHDFDLAAKLIASLPDSVVTEGESYARLRRTFDFQWRPYATGALVAAKYVGGMEHRRHHVGDKDGTVPFTPVSIEEQRRALTLISERIWAADAFEFEPELLAKLQFQRQQDLEGTLWQGGRIDYPVLDTIHEVQVAPLGSLLATPRLTRLVDLASQGIEAVTVDELFATLHKSIWSELRSGSSITAQRRALQAAHLDELIAIALDERGAPVDAVSLARMELTSLRSEAVRAAPRMRDRTTKAHLERVKAEVDATLDAKRVR